METERAPYGRQRKGETGFRRPYSGESYYDIAAIKPSYYKWLIATYFFVGGIAGAAQVIATIADLTGRKRHRSVVSAGRSVALAGALISPALLIKDLHTSRRFFNMLRIYRGTSPMNIGSWILSAFGMFSGLAAVAHLAGSVFGLGRRAATLFGIPAAVLGSVMSFYTGTLLAATSIPLWAAAYRLLPAWFAASATATATAALSLVLDVRHAPVGPRHRLRRLALVAGVADLALASAVKQQWQRDNVDAPMKEEPIASTYRLGALGLGMIVPTFVHTATIITGRESRAMSVFASVATLAGGFIMRAVIVFAGNASASSAQEYLRFTQPGTQNGRTSTDATWSTDVMSKGRDEHAYIH